MVDLNRHLLIGSLEFLKAQCGFDWLAIPVRIWKVRVPKYSVEPKLFSDAIHRLIQTGPMSTEELHSLTGLDRDLILYIIAVELRDKIVPSGNLWKATVDTPVEPQFIQYAEYAVFQLMHSGELLPRPQRMSDSFGIRTTDAVDGFPYIEYGTKGKPKRVSPFFLPLFGHGDPQPPQNEDIMEMWSKFREDLSFADDDALGMMGGGIPSIGNIESVIESDNGYLLTRVIKDDAELDGWFCADPFGISNRGLAVLKSIVSECSRSVPALAQKIGEHETVSCSIDYHRKVEEIFGSGMPQSLHKYIARYLMCFEEWETEPDALSKAMRAEQLMISNQLVLESLFQSTWSYSSLVNRIIRNTFDMQDRITHIRTVATKLGLSEISFIVNRLKHQDIWKRAHNREVSLKSALLYRLFLVQFESNDPFHEVFTLMCDVPSLIITIADLRNKTGHAQSDVENHRIDPDKLQLFFEKTKEIIGMTINRRAS